MSGPSRHAPLIEKYFDGFGDEEWGRLTRAPIDEISLHIHATWLARHVARGDRVLEIGAGAGRFTELLHRIGARVVVADVSAVQLDFNRKHGAELGFDASVEGRVRADICDMRAFADASFDAVVAYGGPLSYALERRDDAAAECARVARPGGVLLASVMSLWGTLNRWYGNFVRAPSAMLERFIETGDLTPETAPGTVHPCHHYRADELRSLLGRHGWNDVRLAASHGVAHLYDPILAQARARHDVWSRLLSTELASAESPGYVEVGTHILAAATRAR